MSRFKSMVSFLAVLFTCLPGMDGIQDGYNGHEVWTVTPRTRSQLEYIAYLQDHAHKLQLDFWRDATSPGSPVMFLVPPSRRSEMWEKLVSRGTLPNVTIPDVQRAIYIQSASMDQDLQTRPAGFDYSRYHTLEEINQWMTDMASKFPNLVTLFNISQSYEGRNITAMKITGSRKRPTKPGFFLSAGMHAREWIAPATLIYIAGQLIKQYGNNPAVTQLVDSMEWVILPVFNVDGYTYTWTTDRLWRKTRSRQENETCVGVDPNRNWDWKWCEKGASKDPCSPIYCGRSVTSEPEVKGVADFIESVPGRFKAYVDFHGYLQVWLSPWGHSRGFPRRYIVQRLCSNEALRALTAVHGTRYRQGTAALTLYVISGAGMDWAYGVAKIPYAFTVELRDTGKYGFLLPANQIIPSGEETLQGIMAMARFILRYT